MKNQGGRVPPPLRNGLIKHQRPELMNQGQPMGRALPSQGGLTFIFPLIFFPEFNPFCMKIVYFTPVADGVKQQEYFAAISKEESVPLFSGAR